MALDLTQFLQNLADAKPEQRLRIANYLKKAGFYSGKASAEFNSRLITAVSKAEQEIDMLKPFVGDIDRLTFYVQKSKEGAVGQDGKPSRITSRTISDPTEFFDDIDSVTTEYFGRELPQAAKLKLAKKRVAKEKSGEFDVTTTYNTDGSFRQTTGGGQTPTQFFIEEISNTDEARANKVLRGYAAMLNLLGGLR